MPDSKQNTRDEIWGHIRWFGECADPGHSDHQGRADAISTRGCGRFRDVWRNRSTVEICLARRTGTSICCLAVAESTLREKHFSAIDALVKDEKSCQERKQKSTLSFFLVDLCKAMAVLGEASPRAMDAVASLGERMNIRLLASVVQEAGIKAKPMETTDLLSRTFIIKMHILISKLQRKRRERCSIH